MISNENGVVDYLRIIYREGGRDEVIHATGSSYAEHSFSNVWSGRSVVREHINFRSYWRDTAKFVGLGRLQGGK